MGPRVRGTGPAGGHGCDRLRTIACDGLTFRKTDRSSFKTARRGDPRAAQCGDWKRGADNLRQKRFLPVRWARARKILAGSCQSRTRARSASRHFYFRRARGADSSRGRVRTYAPGIAWAGVCPDRSSSCHPRSCDDLNPGSRGVFARAEPAPTYGRQAFPRFPDLGRAIGLRAGRDPEDGVYQPDRAQAEGSSRGDWNGLHARRRRRKITASATSAGIRPAAGGRSLASRPGLSRCVTAGDSCRRPAGSLFGPALLPGRRDRQTVCPARRSDGLCRCRRLWCAGHRAVATGVSAAGTHRFPDDRAGVDSARGQLVERAVAGVATPGPPLGEFRTRHLSPRGRARGRQTGYAPEVGTDPCLRHGRRGQHPAGLWRPGPGHHALLRPHGAGKE